MRRGNPQHDIGDEEADVLSHLLVTRTEPHREIDPEAEARIVSMVRRDEARSGALGGGLADRGADR